MSDYAASATPAAPTATSTEALSPERLAEIAARTEAATTGPWCTDAWEIYQGTEYVPGVSLWIGETCRGTGSPKQDRADAAFVAHAREDVPALLADNARLRARVAELEAVQQDGTPIPARWDRTVILPEHPNGDSDGDTIVCCIADDGRPIGLFLNDEHREALGLLLVDPHSDDEGVAA